MHGKTTVLEAVLTDAKAAEVDQYWLLGDILDAREQDEGY